MCPDNPLGIKPGDGEMLAIVGVEVPVGKVEMRDPVAPSGTAPEQVATEGLVFSTIGRRILRPSSII